MNLQSILEELYKRAIIGYPPSDVRDKKKAIAQAKSGIEKLVGEGVKAYDDYIVLLGKELDEVVPLAHTHGWRSSRYEEGKEARKKILEIRRRMNG